MSMTNEELELQLAQTNEMVIALAEQVSVLVRHVGKVGDNQTRIAKALGMKAKQDPA